jgi:biopolymer transport protein ExbD
LVVVVLVGCSKEPLPPLATQPPASPALTAVAQVHLEPGVVTLNGAMVKAGELAEKLRAVRAQTPSVELHLDAAAGVPYEQVLEAIDAARQAGIVDVSVDSGPVQQGETPQKH